MELLRYDVRSRKFWLKKKSSSIDFDRMWDSS